MIKKKKKNQRNKEMKRKPNSLPGHCFQKKKRKELKRPYRTGYSVSCCISNSPFTTSNINFIEFDLFESIDANIL